MKRTTGEIIALLLTGTICLVLLTCLIFSFFETLPVFVSQALSHMLSVMVGGVVGYIAAKNPPE